LIDAQVRCNYVINGKLGFGAPAASRAKLPPSCRVGDEGFDSVCQGDGIARWYQQPISVMRHDLAAARNVGRHDRATASCRLQQDLWHTFAVMRRQTDDACLRYDGVHIGAFAPPLNCARVVKGLQFSLGETGRIIGISRSNEDASNIRPAIIAIGVP
jgi:hypothetical protein